MSSLCIRGEASPNTENINLLMTASRNSSLHLTVWCLLVRALAYPILRHKLTIYKGNVCDKERVSRSTQRRNHISLTSQPPPWGCDTLHGRLWSKCHSRRAFLHSGTLHIHLSSFFSCHKFVENWGESFSGSGISEANCSNVHSISSSLIVQGLPRF